MKSVKKVLFSMLLVLGIFLSVGVTVYADNIGNTGGTSQGNITGSNVYTFYYLYDKGLDAITLKVVTKNAISGFGNTNSHTFTSASDNTVLNTSSPKLGSSLDSAISSMNSEGGYNLSVEDAKSALNKLGYYDSGNGIWKYSGGYLTYVSAVKIRPKVHTVSYDANGGSGAPGNQTKTAGSAMNISTTKPTRNGYNFTGWTASIGGTYQPGDNYTHDQDGGTVTMKANWSAWVHTITYDANGGSGAPGNQTKKTGEALYLSNTKPTRNGYNFTGWTASIGGTYQPGQNYTHDQDGGTVTMKANWSAWIHTITYDANGGSGAPGNQIKQTGVALNLSNTKPSRTGYTFKYWTASIGGTYQPGQNYTHDQDGGIVTMKAYWLDETNPSCSNFSATPNQWSSGNGTVSFTAQDQGSGLESVVLERYSYVSAAWSTVKTWSYNGSTKSESGSYTETSEGVFYYKITIKDKAGNATVKTSSAIYLDHSSPVILGTENTVTSWTSTAPVINVRATDYLNGTLYNGSGLKNIVIKNDSGTVVSQGVTNTNYTLTDSYQGTHTWTISATDNVGHTRSTSITTHFDKTGPECSYISATPNYWSAGNGTVSFLVRDPWSGLSSAKLERYSYADRMWNTVRTWYFNGSTSYCSGSYTETSEGVFYYRLTLSDTLGNRSVHISSTIYLDHSNPVIYGLGDTVTDWTNAAPVINVRATDYLSGKSFSGSGLRSLIIKDDNGTVVASGITSVSYTLQARYEGIHTWHITAVDNVGHSSSGSVTTKYDFTKPGIDGTEITFVKPDGVTVSGYCQDNIISQHIDDEASRSVNAPNVTSGLKSVVLYRVKRGVKTPIHLGQTSASFGNSNTHTSFNLYYDINLSDEYEDYYQIVVQDYAGNITIKKLTSQKSLLTWFHTSIDRGSYE